jgi:GNAT superfamily N-acetyltransferase
MNGKSFLRNRAIERWRYLESPNFEPEMVQIAEDRDKNKIVGSVFVNLLEKIDINGESYLVGDINDVSCHPDYTQRGIATKLMKMATEYMKRKKCDLSILTAGREGFARKRIYLRLGYRDLTYSNLYLSLPHPFQLIKDLPIVILILPAILFFAIISRLILKLKILFSSFFKDFSYEIIFYKKHLTYMDQVNKILPKYYIGFSKYDKEKLKWARINVPSKREMPTYILIKKNKQIIGGACFTYERILMPKSHISFRICIIHEIFIEKEVFPNAKLLRLGFQYLIEKIVRAAIARKLGIILYYGDSQDIFLRSSFQKLCFLTIKGSVLMVKIFNPQLSLKKLKKKPFFIPTYVSVGFP